jgi:hypothetical protein
MNHNTKIELTDTLMDIMYKMSEGNPGAMTVLMRIMKESGEIDPQCADPIMHVLGLDSHGIYGPRIWMFYKDACKENLAFMLAVMRSVQLGLMAEKIMIEAIDNYGRGLDADTITANIKKELPDFCFENKSE